MRDRALGARRKLAAILRVRPYRRMAIGIAAVYLVLFLVALRDLGPGGDGWQALTVEWTRMFDRTGPVTFEPVALLSAPGITLLVSPLNILIGVAVAVLAAFNLVLTWIAFRQPKACSFNRSGGILASVPALLAGGACCAPALVLILGLQVSSLFIAVFQVLIPASLVLLLASLKLILDRTNPKLLSARAPAGAR